MAAEGKYLIRSSVLVNSEELVARVIVVGRDIVGAWQNLPVHDTNYTLFFAEAYYYGHHNMRILVLICLLSAFVGIHTSVANDRPQSTAHDFSFDKPEGGKINLSAYARNVILVVNTASNCSFTKQYGPLQSLYEKYRDQGLVIVGVPSNDFGRQEPGSDEEIAEFTSERFQVQFPIASKTKIKGAMAESGVWSV